MSREELVAGYTTGRLSRRVFVKGLVALGVTGTAAVAYANALSAAPAITPRQSLHADLYDVYPPADPSSVSGAGAAAPVAATPTFTG